MGVNTSRRCWLIIIAEEYIYIYAYVYSFTSHYRKKTGLYYNSYYYYYYTHTQNRIHVLYTVLYTRNVRYSKWTNANARNWRFFYYHCCTQLGGSFIIFNMLRFGFIFFFFRILAPFDVTVVLQGYCARRKSVSLWIKNVSGSCNAFEAVERPPLAYFRVRRKSFWPGPTGKT